MSFISAYFEVQDSDQMNEGERKQKSIIQSGILIIIC